MHFTHHSTNQWERRWVMPTSNEAHFWQPLVMPHKPPDQLLVWLTRTHPFPLLPSAAQCLFTHNGNGHCLYPQVISLRRYACWSGSTSLSWTSFPITVRTHSAGITLLQWLFHQVPTLSRLAGQGYPLAVSTVHHKSVQEQQLSALQ